MNKIFFTLVFVLTAMISGFSQTEEELVKSIREWFTATNSGLSSYDLTEKEVSDESTEGGAMKAYYQNKELKLLHCEFFGEMGNIVEDYYYNSGNLYFVFSVRTTYSAPVYEEVEKTTTSEENRYYFNNEKMIRWLDKDKVKVDVNSEDFKTMGQSIFDESKRLLEVFNSH
jgi:hypothetical protein